MRLRKQPHHEELEFQIAPMVDVLLVLLVFFITITSASQLRSDKSLHLPVAKNGVEKKKETGRAEAILNVRWLANEGKEGKGTVTMDDIKYEKVDDLVPVLTPLYKKNNALRALIRADKEALASYIQKVMTACAQAGIVNITFATLNKED